MPCPSGVAGRRNAASHPCMASAQALVSHRPGRRSRQVGQDNGNDLLYDGCAAVY